jgi:hypothetical protein
MQKAFDGSVFTRSLVVGRERVEDGRNTPREAALRSARHFLWLASVLLPLVIIGSQVDFFALKQSFCGLWSWS